MNKFIFQFWREIRNLCSRIFHAACANVNVTEKLAVIRVVIHWKIRNFLNFSHVVKQRRCDEQISVNHWIMLRKILAHVRDAERMLQKSAHESMMNTLRCRMFLKCIDKLFIFHKIHFQNFSQIFVLHTCHIFQNAAKHFSDIFVRARHIIRRVIFALVADADAGNVHLQISLKTCHHSFAVNIIHRLKISNTIIQLPNFSVCGSRFIL